MILLQTKSEVLKVLLKSRRGEEGSQQGLIQDFFMGEAFYARIFWGLGELHKKLKKRIKNCLHPFLLCFYESDKHFERGGETP